MNKNGNLVNIALKTGIVLLTAILLYALCKSKLHLSGILETYFFISVAGIVVLAVVLNMGSDKFKVNFLLSLISLVSCVVMTEIFIDYYNFMKSQNAKDSNLRAEFNKEMGLPFDLRDSYQVMMDLKKDGINSYPNIVPNNFVYTNGLDYDGTKIYPLGSISDTTTILCNESGEFVIYKSDEHGFRNPGGTFDKDDLDIVLIGDSFANGNCVKDIHDTAGWLRNANKSVLNLGSQASGPLIEHAILKEYAQPLKPRYVVWLYFEGNDDRDLIKEKKSSTLMKYLDKDFSQDLIFKQKLLDNILISFMKIKMSYKEAQVKNSKDHKNKFTLNFRQTLQLVNLRFKLGLIQGCFFHIDPLLKDILIQAKRDVNEWGGQFIFVYIPSWERFQKSIICRHRLLSLQHQQVTALIQELDIPLIDIKQILNSHDDPLSLYPYRLRSIGHFNSKGYQLIAKEILDYTNNH